MPAQLICSRHLKDCGCESAYSYFLKYFVLTFKVIIYLDTDSVKAQIIRQNRLHRLSPPTHTHIHTRTLARAPYICARAQTNTRFSYRNCAVSFPLP